MLNQHIGHCSRDEPSTSRSSTELQRIPSDRSLQQLKLENVQLTEYKNGEMIELQEQDFFHLQKEAFRDHKLFKDPQFPKELFLNSGQNDLRPKDIVEKPQEPVIFIDNKKPFHVKQGKLGDCWFVVGLLHLQYYPNLFRFIVSPHDQTFNAKNYAGIFHFRFWQAGTWVDVVIDDRLPTVQKTLIYASSGYPNEFWPALIEKAYAKLLYRSYKNLIGGFSKISMPDLSGCISETYVIKSTSNELFKIIQNAKDRSTMISCSTVNQEEFQKFKTPVLRLLPHHSYAITAVKTVTIDKIDGEFKLIRIRNPQGRVSKHLYHGNIKYFFNQATLESKLDTEIDGESWILYDDFIKYFSYVEICNLTPNQITNHVYSNTGKKLALSAIEGKFIGAVTPKQIVSNNFYKINPQYRMVLTKSDEGKNTSTVLIGISLKRRHDLEKISTSLIYFEMISVS
ncbi:calpain-A-like [Aphidius gifuensis]|uniref:calpain-A-like n=1 Tax=Aphidius gifuensis TaxID=684658 RepID=UPI001CDB8A17|nr:calpain-A-like [Aphidius gifuensis]